MGRFSMFKICSGHRNTRAVGLPKQNGQGEHIKNIRSQTQFHVKITWKNC